MEILGILIMAGEAGGVVVILLVVLILTNFLFLRLIAWGSTPGARRRPKAR